ncbi:Lrp/AsnC family transcriptional regulator [Mucilaginibacter sp. AW1-3]
MINGKLDDIDLKILAQLQRDARINNVALGKLVNLSSGPVQTRIEKLEEAGYIERYQAIVNRVAVGRPVLVVLLICLQNQQASQMRAFELMLSALPEVQSCYIVAGKWNFVVHVSMPSPQVYAVWLFEHITSHENIKEVQSNFMLFESKSYSGLPL